MRVNEAGGRGFFGVGAFNLLARDAFSRTAGFAYLRMETADDVGVGMLLKYSGASCAVVLAFGLASVLFARFMKGFLRAGRRVRVPF
jgi:hypothetical protein